MTDETKSPFFINTRRLQRAEGYFDIGRSQDKIRRFLEQRRNSIILPPDNEEYGGEYGLVGYYGIDRHIKLDENDEDSDEDPDPDGVEDDVQYQNTSMFSLFWMTFKNVAASIGEHFSKPRPPRRESDPESNSEEVIHSASDLSKILVHPPTLDPRVKEDMVVYGDMKYLVQQFRLSLKRGSVDVALFSVELPESPAKKTIDHTDLQTFVVSPECGSLVWIENGRASAIFITKSTEHFFGSVMEWFRKLLSDMTLADSVMIGHPYYWQPNIRRRLSRVLRQLKRLYQKLALKDMNRQRGLRSSRTETQFEMVCPQEISKIVINEHPSQHLMRCASTHDTLNVMLEHLVTKWFHSKYTEPKKSVEDIAKTYSASHPPRTFEETNDGADFLESVTFLDFYPCEREDSDANRIQESNIFQQQPPHVIDMEERGTYYDPSKDSILEDENSNRRLDENDNPFQGEGCYSQEELFDNCTVCEVDEDESSSTENHSPKLKHRHFHQ